MTTATRRRSGKDAAAGEKDESQEAGAPAATEKPDRMANWAQGEARIVQVGDRALLKLAATAVKGAAKRAKSLNAGLLRCAQVGVSFLIEKAVKLRDSERDDVGVEDTATMDNQLLTLERLARDLGMQGQLWKEPAAKEEEDDDQLDLDEDNEG